MASAKRPRRRINELEVPDISENSAERKRILNVLAQRRYRRRKRAHIAALEAQLEKPGSGSQNLLGTDENSHGSDSATDDPQNSIAPQISTPLEFSEHEIPSICNEDFSFFEGVLLDSLNGVNTNVLEPDPNSYKPACIPTDFGAGPISTSSTPARTTSGLSNIPSLSRVFETQVPGSPPPPSLSDFPFELPSDQVNLQGIESQDVSSRLQSHQSSNFTFPDDRLIDVPGLNLLRAVMAIATRLGLTDHLWNVAGISPFYTGPGGLGNISTTPTSPNQASSSSTASTAAPPTALASLPANFHPTTIQRLVPHHAFLDLLPWPTTRDKLIQVFSIPTHLRPPSAANPMGIVSLIYDMEDPAEGMRVSGPDPFSPDMWEVGQLVFQRWWWAFEGSIVESSNRLRWERGQKGLVIGMVD